MLVELFHKVTQVIEWLPEERPAEVSEAADGNRVQQGVTERQRVLAAQSPAVCLTSHRLLPVIVHV